MSLFLIGYDITDKRRIARVFRRLKAYAVPLQYSVFLLEGNEQDLQRCLDEILPLIDKDEDDLRCYPLPSRGIKVRMGKAWLPEGIVLGALTENAHLLGVR